MTLKLVIVPEGAGSNQVHEFSSYEELNDFVATKLHYQDPQTETAEEEEVPSEEAVTDEVKD